MTFLWKLPRLGNTFSVGCRLAIYACMALLGACLCVSVRVCDCLRLSAPVCVCVCVCVCVLVNGHACGWLVVGAYALKPYQVT